MIKKRGRLGWFFEGGPRARDGPGKARWIPDPPPFLHFQRTKQNRTKAQSTEVKKNTQARHARKRGGGFLVFNIKWPKTKKLPARAESDFGYDWVLAAVS